MRSTGRSDYPMHRFKFKSPIKQARPRVNMSSLRQKSERRETAIFSSWRSRVSMKDPQFGTPVNRASRIRNSARVIRIPYNPLAFQPTAPQRRWETSLSQFSQWTRVKTRTSTLICRKAGHLLVLTMPPCRTSGISPAAKLLRRQVGNRQHAIGVTTALSWPKLHWWYSRRREQSRQVAGLSVGPIGAPDASTITSPITHILVSVRQALACFKM
jgi:hypothetical protein